MVAAEVVRQMGRLAELGWGAKRIARELGVARNTVKRYLRGAPAEVQEHLAARRLDAAARAEALRLFDGEAEGNAVVVARLLRDHGCCGTMASQPACGRCSARSRTGAGASELFRWRRCGSRRRRASRCRSTSANAWFALLARWCASSSSAPFSDSRGGSSCARS